MADGLFPDPRTPRADIGVRDMDRPFFAGPRSVGHCAVAVLRANF